MSNLLLVTAFFRKLSSILFSCIYRPKLRPQKKVHQHSLRLSREVSLQEHYRFWTVWMKKKKLSWCAFCDVSRKYGINYTTISNFYVICYYQPSCCFSFFTFITIFALSFRRSTSLWSISFICSL